MATFFLAVGSTQRAAALAVALTFCALGVHAQPSGQATVAVQQPDGRPAETDAGRDIAKLLNANLE